MTTDLDTGRLSLIEGPALEPVTLDEAKNQARIDTDDDDDLITAFIAAAREYAETFTHRAFITQRWQLTFDGGFPRKINLPKPPLQSVEDITYIDLNGAMQTESSTLYVVSAPSGPKADFGFVVPAYSVIWPTTRSIIDAVTVPFTCGYGDDPGDVPELIKAAIRLHVAEFYKMREQSVEIRGTVAQTPFGVDALLWPYRAMRFF